MMACALKPASPVALWDLIHPSAQQSLPPPVPISKSMVSKSLTIRAKLDSPSFLSESTKSHVPAALR